MISIRIPDNIDEIRGLKAGDEILLDGVIFTARDQAHKRIAQAIHDKKNLPFPLKGTFIYYSGPTETPSGRAIGSCGPTTSRRMDRFTPLLLTNGLRGMIGKGDRCDEVIEAIKKTRSVYFVAFAGCGALISRFVDSASIAAYEDLGPEAVFRLRVSGLPLIVAIDSRGNDIFRL